MTPQQIVLVRMSFAAVRPIADSAAALFYGRLFKLDPSLRLLFKTDLHAQGQLLMRMIGLAVDSLDRLDALAPTLASLGRRHAGYGVRDRHYDTVGAALLWTLEQGLGTDFTPETREAWISAYALLARTMQAGAAASVAA